jgi:hypothetical protein
MRDSTLRGRVDALFEIGFSVFLRAQAAPGFHRRPDPSSSGDHMP